MTEYNPAPYMRWAKTRPPARLDLAGSNLVPCTPEELPGLFDGVPYNGLNPDGYPPLRDAIAKRYGVSPEQVALSTGCSGANFLVCAALLTPGDEALIETPFYDPLAAAARLTGARVVHFERRFEESWAVSVARLQAAVTARTRLIVLSSPHNPTGVAASPECLHAIGELAARCSAWVLVDQVYRDIPSGELTEIAARIHERCITTSSLTKAYGLPGLRCGWTISSPALADRIQRTRDAVDAVGSFPSEVAAARAFDQLPNLEARARELVEPNLALLNRFMQERPELAWVPPDGGSVAFLRVVGSRDAGPFVERLLRDYETAVVPGRFFGAPEGFRIAFGTPPAPFTAGLRAIAQSL